MVDSVISYFEQLSIAPEIIIVLIAIMPIIELRGSIPAGIFLLKLPIWYVFIVSVIANIIIIPIIIYGMGIVEKIITKRTWGEKIMTAFNNHIRKKHTRKIERYKLMALFIFVAIPMPMTGAWTGSFIAYVFGLPPKRAMIYIACGVFTAGILVTLLSTGIFHIIN